MTDTVKIPTRMLVDAMVREDDTVDAGELYAVANALGMSDEQVRVCLRRLVQDGRFTREGRGRRAVLRATDVSRRLLAPNVEFVRFAYRQDRGEAPWDGVWHLVAFAVPESARTARDALRAAIGRFGGAPIQGGLYVCANAWEPLVEAEARRLDVLDALTVAATTTLSLGHEQNPRRLAERLWPLEEVAARYERLLRIARGRLKRLEAARAPTPEDALVMAMELAAEFTRAMEPDPLLPPELLPRRWPGVQARAVYARAWRRLHERTDASASPRLFHAYAEVRREADEAG